MLTEIVSELGIQNQKSSKLQTESLLLLT